VVECIARAAEAVDAVRAGKHGSESEKGEDVDEDEEVSVDGPGRCRGLAAAAAGFGGRQVDADDPIPLGYLLVL
jgi:hypothetical protein